MHMITTRHIWGNSLSLIDLKVSQSCQEESLAESFSPAGRKCGCKHVVWETNVGVRILWNGVHEHTAFYESILSAGLQNSLVKLFHPGGQKKHTCCWNQSAETSSPWSRAFTFWVSMSENNSVSESRSSSETDRLVDYFG